MNIGFVNFSPLVYDVSTPYKEPLGGSESAMCYLAVELARREHKVTLFTKLKARTKTLGVDCIPVNLISQEIIDDLDFLVVQNSPLQGFQIKPHLNSKTKLVLWSQHASDQGAVEALKTPQVRDAYNKYVLISNWQKKDYINTFLINPKKCVVLKNATSPFFENLKYSKKKLPILVYTSTPFRGLDLLLQLFPEIKRKVPEAKLRVFSSLKVYQVDEKTDLEGYGKLYEACRDTPGVEYLGSVSQRELAKQLHQVSVFAYPNTFAETSCICAMEAMAAGLYLVTSKLGALPETTAGFAKLIEVDGNWHKYGNQFIDSVVKFLKNSSDLSKQVAYANNNYTWKIRAKEWEEWMKQLVITS